MQINILDNAVQTFFSDLPYGPLLQTVLRQRCKDESAIHEYLKKDHELYDPYTIYGMQAAVSYIENAIAKNASFAIHGDFDVDGVCATTILWDYLYYQRGVTCTPIIPNRVDEGYGLSDQTVQKAINRGADVIITVDCGIKDIEIVQKYRTSIDFIITDHHQFLTDEKNMIMLPEAQAVVHSAHPEGKFPVMISGAATSWQLVRAIEIHRKKLEVNVENYLDLVALSTVCDIIPLQGENRKLVQVGLKVLKENPGTGISELIQHCNISNPIDTFHCGFVLGPRLNAASRVTHDAMDALRLLATRNQQQATRLAVKLDSLNTERKQLTETYIARAEQHIDNKKKGIVIIDEAWPEGILGLIAGRLAEKYQRPVYIGSIDSKGHIIGSSRSPLRSFPLHKSLEYAASHLERYGGHMQAAGFASTEGLIHGFEDTILEYIEQCTQPDDFLPTIDVDIEIGDISTITLEEIEELSLLEPFGLGNPKPLCLLRACKLLDFKMVGSLQNHVKMKVVHGRTPVDVIGFNMPDIAETLSIGKNINLVGHLRVNEWNGSLSRELELKYLEDQES